MRKSLGLTLALALLAVAVLLGATAVVGAQTARVTLTEQASAGDAAAAQGVRLQLHMRETAALAHLHWETNYTVGGAADTAFTYSTAGQRESETPYAYVELSLSGSEDGSGDFDLASCDETEFAWIALYRAVAENTGSGETRTETLLLSDYYDALPLSVMVYDSRPSGEGIDTRAVKNYFRFPVPEGCTAAVTVTKDAAGAVSALRLRIQNCPEVQSTGCWTADGVCYFAVEGTGVPDAYHRIYRVDLDLSGEHDAQVRAVTALAPELSVEGLRLSSDGGRLFVTAREGRAYTLRVVDAASGALLQTLPLQEAELCQSVYDGDGFAVYTFPAEAAQEDAVRYVVAATPADGDCSVALTGTVAREDARFDGYGVDMDFNGELLAVVNGWLSEEQTYYRGVDLALYDADGLRYTVRYAVSLLETPWRQDGSNVGFSTLSPYRVTLP